MQAYEDFPDQAELTARRLQKAVTALQRWREKYETEVAGTMSQHMPMHACNRIAPHHAASWRQYHGAR